MQWNERDRLWGRANRREKSQALCFAQAVLLMLHRQMMNDWPFFVRGSRRERELLLLNSHNEDRWAKPLTGSQYQPSESRVASTRPSLEQYPVAKFFGCISSKVALGVSEHFISAWTPSKLFSFPERRLSDNRLQALLLLALNRLRREPQRGPKHYTWVSRRRPSVDFVL